MELLKKILWTGSGHLLPLKHTHKLMDGHYQIHYLHALLVLFIVCLFETCKIHKHVC